ncbi:phosphonate metabolism transcriptional regulator PhnF [Actibacterium sp. 188UL27-1]|uniref:phosphonate metabolism transcriptional regulator PhnF n=1 Tax=Actibacterium sp. 188UL27-1 TaxID=2786961 RepID=UPI00195C9CCC|nr:phosphonate metabolism transcriptional regulator PhnF [Actibacterium sp. 188UL27-1]MBM7067974.1 phosphonate metabolism transcriptional regulator PhnF [Actibacterium sp. 188UL27-1]
MARSPIWQTIAQTLREDISAGHYLPGGKMPTEAQLAERFGVNRHTVRRALKDLADAGTVFARRGAGVFVTAKPTPYPIGRRVRFHQNLAAMGRIADRKLLRLETRSADKTERSQLELPEHAPVHIYEGVSFADRAPIALFVTAFPAEMFPALTEALQQTFSVTEALKSCGLKDYTRIRTQLTAERANSAQAAHLRINEGAPLLKTESVNIDGTGSPVEYGQTWFVGDRVTLTVSEDD